MSATKTKNIVNHWVKSFFLITLSFVFAVACHYSFLQHSSSSIESSNTAETCIAVQHLVGETCVPSKPQRIVILDEFYLLDNLTALGIKPIGYTPCLGCFSSDFLSKHVAETPSLGYIQSPSLEKIISSKPDLILSLYWHEEIYPLLSDIAPTVMIEASEITGFKETLKYLAKILGRSDCAKGILDKYENKVQGFQQQLGERLKTKTVSVIRIGGSPFFVDRLDNSIYGQVMLDLGIKFTPAHESIKNSENSPVSIEALPDWDADFLFVLQSYEKHAEEFEAMTEHPIWSTLSAVQSGNAHPIVLDVWGPLTAIQFIDDLYQYFSEAL